MWRVWIRCLALIGLIASGCGDVLPRQPGPLFTVPLEVRGRTVEPAIIDTGGGYELMLADSFGLKIVERVEVLAFGGLEAVGVTEGFPYRAGGWPAEADAALVGLSICECNGLGFEFFRKTGAVLGLDFPALTAAFVPVVPPGGVTIQFQPPPAQLANFQSAFTPVEIVAGDETMTVAGLLDTGTNVTVMRRGLIGKPSRFNPNRTEVRIRHEQLGTVQATVHLFDTAGLPDIILGTDVMWAWSDRWFFFFARRGGSATAFPRALDPVVTSPDSPAPDGIVR